MKKVLVLVVALLLVAGTAYAGDAQESLTLNVDVALDFGLSIQHTVLSIPSLAVGQTKSTYTIISCSSNETAPWQLDISNAIPLTGGASGTATIPNTSVGVYLFPDEVEGVPLGTTTFGFEDEANLPGAVGACIYTPTAASQTGDHQIQFVVSPPSGTEQGLYTTVITFDMYSI